MGAMVQERFEFSVAHATTKDRIDKLLSNLNSDLSRNRVQSLISDGHVLVDGEAVTHGKQKPLRGQHVVVGIPELVDPDPEAQNIPLDIVFEDEHLLVINKAAGMVVHPGAGNHDGTLVNALLHHCGDSLSGIGGVKRPGIVHRLDKDTSGLMIVAKHDKAHKFLSNQLADRSLSRVYWAVCWGVPEPIVGRVDLPIGRSPHDRQKMCIRRKDGRDAATRYKVIDRFGHEGQAISLVECKLESGRTHQIRVHFQALGYCLLGDRPYAAPLSLQKSLLRRGEFTIEQGLAALNFPRQALHARELSFVHPKTKETMTFSADPADDFQELLDTLKGE